MVGHPPSRRVALGALSLAPALALARVFGGASWIVPVAAAALWPHVVGAARFRRPLVAPLADVAGVVLLLTWAVLPATAFAGLPTATTATEAARLLAEAPEVLRGASVPVDPAGAALLLAIVAAWAAALAARAIAARRGGLAVILPGLALFVIVIALGKGPSGASTALFAAAIGGYLVADHRERAFGGRPWLSVPGQPSRGRFALAAGGTIVVAGTVVATTLLTPLLPGAGADPLLDYRELGDGGRSRDRLVIVSPLVDLRRDLVRPDPVEVFRVRASRPAYWRLIALDEFDGRYWGLQGRSSGPEALGPPAASAPEGTGSPLDQEFVITGLGGELLPAAYRPVAIDRDDVRVVREQATLVRDGVRSHDRYRVRSRVGTDPELLTRAGPADPRAHADQLALPDDFPDSVVALAHDVVAGAPGPYGQALALQTWFRTEFRYSTAVPAGHAVDDVERFVLETRAGYCEQFAGSFAAMARAVGLPARVAVGFTPGTPDGAGVWRVTTEEAHAWPEVWIDGAGWITFEPTPGRFDPTPGDPTGTGIGAPAPDGVAPGPDPTPPAVPDPPAAPADPGPQPAPGEPAPPGAGPDAAPASRAAWVVLGGVVTALVAATAVAVATAPRRRRRRARRDPDLRRQVHAAWSEALGRLARRGIHPPPSATPLEFALRHAPARGVGAAGPPLVALARCETAARYDRRPPGAHGADRAWSFADALAGALGERDRAPGARRWSWPRRPS